MLQSLPFIRVYREEARKWVETYQQNADPETWSWDFFWGKFEAELMDRIPGFEEEKRSANRVCEEENRLICEGVLKINQCAEKVCKEHYKQHEYRYDWTRPPQNRDLTPQPVPEGYVFKENAGYFRDHEQGILQIGDLFLSWHTYKPGSEPIRTYYSVSLPDGLRLGKQKWVWNSDLPRARKPLVRHAKAIEHVQEISRLLSWSNYTTQFRIMSKAQRRGLGNNTLEILEKIGNTGN